MENWTDTLKAAQSLLEDSSSSSASSKRDFENQFRFENSENAGDETIPEECESILLRSLQHPKLNPIPEEQDRKKFLGCLAAITAVAFPSARPGSAHGRSRPASAVPDDSTLQDKEDDDDGLDNSFSRDFYGSESSRTTASTLPPETVSSSFHRRRHAVVSQFLLDSALYLLLEKGQAKAYLPLLSLSDSQLPSQQYDNVPHLAAFLDNLSPEAAFRSLSLLLLNHLIHCPHGYDARIRRVLKLTAILTLQQHPEISTKQFESLEEAIASRLMKLSGPISNNHSNNIEKEGEEQDSLWSKEHIVRGIKIGGTAFVAGTLFALSGGLAATTIAAGVAALGIGGATAATTALLSPAALTAILGLGGGSLAAYKMRRRVQGLVEFEFIKQSQRDDDQATAQLYSTICLSGWVTDSSDFERPWGVTPKNPPVSLQEKLERFYAIHRPDYILKAPRILEHWVGEEHKLWQIIRQKYGTDPDHLFPLDDGPRYRHKLTLEHEEVVDEQFSVLGYNQGSSAHRKKPRPTPLERVKEDWKQASAELSRLDGKSAGPVSLCTESMSESWHRSEGSSFTSSGYENQIPPALGTHVEMSDANEENKPPRHIFTVWDYQARYGGELYTVKWETILLSDLCNSVKDLAFDLVSGGGAKILLSHTALSSLVTAFAWPLALVNAANLIDGTWTLAVERADEAGKELARSLVLSQSGNRPVTLVGYSFGARVIYSCLKQLSKYQERWEVVHKSTQFSHVEDSRLIENIPEDSPAFFLRIREPASIVEDAVMMGLPNHLSVSSWVVCRQLVSGRLINCYSTKDLILSLMFQVKRFGIKPVCGTCSVDVEGVENFDLSDLIKGHQDYCVMIGKILRRIRHGQPFRADRHKKARSPVNSHGIRIKIDKYDV